MSEREEQQRKGAGSAYAVDVVQPSYPVVERDTLARLGSGKIPRLNTYATFTFQIYFFVYIWQGAVEVPEQQLFFAGDGSAGKTSAREALLSLHGLTEPIHVDDRTVGIDVVRGWRPGGEGSDLEVSLEQIKSKVVKQ